MKKTTFVLNLILAVFVLPGCSTPGNPIESCPSPTADTKLLNNEEDGYCLLYPAYASANPARFIVINPASGPGDVLGESWAGISMEAATGRTAAQAAQAEIGAYDVGSNIERSEVLVDGEQAVVIDGLPGPDPWRKVFIVSNERLYVLTFLPWVPNTDNAERFTQLEHLYTTMMDTLRFLPPTKALPTATLAWGPGHLPPPLEFEYPLDQQVIDYEGAYLFKVTDIEGAWGYLWSFSQNGVVVWENLRDEMGYTAGGEYAIYPESEAHRRFVPGPVEVSVRAQMGDYLAGATTITIILRPATGISE
jgi:hypothetical protein